MIPSLNIPRSSVQTKIKSPRNRPKERMQLVNSNNIDVGSTEISTSQEGTDRNVIERDEKAVNFCDDKATVNDAVPIPNEINIDIEIAEEEDEQLSIADENKFKLIERETIKTFADQCTQVRIPIQHYDFAKIVS